MWWRRLDSNQRRRTPTGLQPVPFNHSGTPPWHILSVGHCNGMNDRNMRIYSQLSTSKDSKMKIKKAFVSPPGQRRLPNTDFQDVKRAHGKAQAIVAAIAGSLRPPTAQELANRRQLPMTGAVDSLNLSAAAAMALYELARKQA